MTLEPSYASAKKQNIIDGFPFSIKNKFLHIEYQTSCTQLLLPRFDKVT